MMNVLEKAMGALSRLMLASARAGSGCIKVFHQGAQGHERIEAVVGFIVLECLGELLGVIKGEQIGFEMSQIVCLADDFAIDRHIDMNRQ
jgi:hypothetical protein